MKSAITTTLFFSLLFFTYSQNDQFTTKIREGTTWTLTMFNTKGKAQQHVNAKVDTVEYKRIKAKFIVDYSLEFHREVRDNKTVYEEEDELVVRSNSLQISSASYFAFPYKNDYRISVYPNRIQDPGFEYPNNPTVGDSIEDTEIYEFTASVSKEGYSDYFRTFSQKLENRVIKGKESIKLKAGTFDCYVIEEDRIMYSTHSPESTTRSKVWFVPNFGIVKMEVYKKGLFSSNYNKLKYYYELTEYTY